MLRDAIIFPLRIGLVASRLGFRLSERAVILGLRTTERFLKVVLPLEAGGESREADARESVELDVVIAAAPGPAPSRTRHRSVPRENGRAATASAPGPSQPTSAEPSRQSQAAPAGATPAPLPEAAPTHISAEPEFVEAFAEAGAEEGAGAAVHVEEPWKGYSRLSANEVIARLAGAPAAELAVVELYEGLHRRRATVLRAAQRELQRSRVASHGAAS